MNLKIKNIDLKAFIFNRLIEILAIGLFLLAILLSLAVITYTPDDPNFIFSEGQKVKNLLGINGSIISDFFFQAEDGIRDQPRSRGLGDVYKRQIILPLIPSKFLTFCPSENIKFGSSGAVSYTHLTLPTILLV